MPLKGAGTAEDGLHVAVRKDKVKAAPLIDEDGHLSQAETADLYRHYGLTPGTTMLSGRTGTGRDQVPPQAGRAMAGQRQGAHAFEECSTLRGHLDGAMLPLKQPRAEMVLESADLMTDGALGQREVGCHHRER